MQPPINYPAPNGLALLGDALASGTADLAAHVPRERERDQERQERLADLAAARQFEGEMRRENWQHEQALYDARRFDSIEDELVKAGYLAPGDAAHPEAVAGAIQRMQAERGPEYLRNVQELAQYKAELPRLVDSLGKSQDGAAIAAEAAKIANATPADIEAVRAIMQKSYAALGQGAQAQYDLRVSGDKNVATMIEANLADLNRLNGEQSALRGEMDRLESGELTNAEKQRVEAIARSAPAVAALSPKELMKPSGQGAMAKARQDAERGFRFERTLDLQKRLATNNRQIEYTAQQIQAAQVADRTGAAAYMKFAPTKPIAALGESAGGQKPPITGPAPATAKDTANATVAALGVASPAKPATATATSPAVAALPIDRTAPAPNNAPPIPGIGSVTDFGDALKANVFDPLGRTLTPDSYKPRPWYGPIEYVGPTQTRLLQEYESRLSQYRDKSAPRAQWLVGEIARLKGAAPAAIATVDEDAAHRAEEDRILAESPYSLSAQEIRRRRGIPDLAAPPAALGF